MFTTIHLVNDFNLLDRLTTEYQLTLYQGTRLSGYRELQFTEHDFEDSCSIGSNEG